MYGKNYNKHRFFEWLTKVRRYLHIKPETAVEETLTTCKVREILTSLGISPQGGSEKSPVYRG